MSCSQSEGKITLPEGRYSVGKPKGTRKVHPYAIRVDVHGESAAGKFVLAAETAQQARPTPRPCVCAAALALLTPLVNSGPLYRGG